MKLKLNEIYGISEGGDGQLIKLVKDLINNNSPFAQTHDENSQRIYRDCVICYGHDKHENDCAWKKLEDYIDHHSV